MASRFLYLVRHGEAAAGGSLSEAGEEQARRTGERLKDLPVTRIYHSPLPRAAQTARLIAGWLPGVPVAESAVAGDYIPADLDPGGLPPSYARLVSSYTTTERNEGAARARAAIEQFTGPPGESPAGGSAPGESPAGGSAPGESPAGGSAPGESPAGESPAAVVHELVVTHNFLIGWFIRHALDAPDWRWIGLNQQNCALTVILYQPGLPPSLVTFNDAAHLPVQLRWTGFPTRLRPGCG